MKIQNWTALLIGFGVFAAAPISAFAAPVLKVGTVTGKAGSTVDLPITLKAGSAQISALQFNLTLPDNVTAGSVMASEQLKAAGKNVTATVRGNTWIVMIYGPNQTTVPPNDLVKASVKIAPQARAGSLKVKVSNVVFSDPKAQSIPAGASNAGVIKVTAEPPTTSSK
jgi:hypothetical protein